MIRKLAAMIALPLLLSACSGSGDTGQVVAQGKAFEVTIGELDQVLSGSPPVAKEKVGVARKALLDKLINQKLLADAAEKHHVDRQPDTMQQIEAAKRSILANAYADQISRSVAEPTDHDVASYYDAHPALFARRRLLTLMQVALPADSRFSVQDRTIFDQSGMDGLAQRFKATGRTFAPEPIEIPTSSMSAAPDAAVERIGVNSKLAFSMGRDLHVGSVTAVRDAPIALDQVRAAISAHIKNGRRAGVIAAEAGRLREQADVKIVQQSLLR